MRARQQAQQCNVVGTNQALHRASLQCRGDTHRPCTIPTTQHNTLTGLGLPPYAICRGTTTVGYRAVQMMPTTPATCVWRDRHTHDRRGVAGVWAIERDSNRQAQLLMIRQ